MKAFISKRFLHRILLPSFKRFCKIWSLIQGLNLRKIWIQRKNLMFELDIRIDLHIRSKIWKDLIEYGKINFEALGKKTSNSSQI